jgi:hypoxanthine phosphoribosyltransferase
MTELQPVQTEDAVRVLFSADQIGERVRELGLVLTRDYWGLRPVLVAVLKGACVFQSDLARAMPMDVELDFVGLSSYGPGTTSSGQVRLVHDLRDDIAGRHVVLVEGVADSGRSISYILDLLRARRPASLKVCALLDKTPCRQVPVPVDYVGFRIGSEFVVGYGMDISEKFRNLPYIGVFQEG